MSNHSIPGLSLINLPVEIVIARDLLSTNSYSCHVALICQNHCESK